MAAVAMTKRGCCHECAARADGRSIVERHHVLGRAISDDITVDIPLNWHRVLHAAEKRRDEVLRHPGLDPLHRIAAAIMRGVDIARAVANYGQSQGWRQWAIDLARIMAGIGEHAANWLLILAGALEEQHGADWAAALELPEWRPRP
jgi:hypothetical protein